MDAKRKKLLQLIEIFKLPLLPEESKEKVDKLNDEEVASLVSSLENSKKYNDAIEEFLKLNMPDEYKKIEEEYTKKINAVAGDDAYLMEKTQENFDIKEDALDVDVERKISDVVDKEEQNITKVEELDQDLYQKINSIIQE